MRCVWFFRSPDMKDLYLFSKKIKFLLIFFVVYYLYDKKL
jgi:hypothetical protein